MKIVIDARFLGPEGTGIGKYTEKLLENLQEIDKQNDYSVLLSRKNFDLFSPRDKNFRKILADSRWYTLKEQVLLPAVLTKLHPDLVHFPHFNAPLLYPGKFVLTVHDITTSEFKNAASTTHSKPIFLLKYAGYELVLGQAINRAKKIFVPSNSVKNKLLENFDLNPEKIVVTYEAVDNVYVRAGKNNIVGADRTQLLKKYKIKEPFIIYIGNAYSYKNLGIVLETLRILNKKIYFVHVAAKNGFVGRLVDKAKEIGVADRYINTGFIPSEDLAEVLQEAEAFVFPSLSEGFGLPGLEAMASGCPLIASDISVFKEIYGDAALFFNPNDPKELAKKIQLVSSDKKLATDLINKGFKQTSKYSWRRMAKQTLKVYESI